MRDAAGELADGLETLGVPEPLLEFATLGRVGEDAVDPRGPALVVALETADREDPSLGAVGGDDAALQHVIDGITRA